MVESNSKFLLSFSSVLCLIFLVHTVFQRKKTNTTQAQLMRDEFPETLCIQQGVVLSFRFAERKVRRAPRVLRMSVVSQSSVKFGKKRVLLVGATNFLITFLNKMKASCTGK